MSGKIIIFFKKILTNGTEYAILDLIKNIKRDFTIVYSEDGNDQGMVDEMSKYAKVQKYEKYMTCDIAIFATQFYEFRDIIFITKKRYQWVHNSPFANGVSCLMDSNHTKNIDLFICVSKATEEELIYYNSDFNTTVIHNFFDVDRILKLSKEPLEEKQSNKTITIVSRMSSEKGIYRLDLFADKIPDWTINVIGAGFDENYENLTRRFLRKKDNIKFLGYKNNPFNYIKNSTYLMCLSTNEGWNRTITEARILGVPILSTNFDSVEEQVIDGVNGYIFDMDFERDITIIENVPKVEPIEWHNEIEKWEIIL